MPPPSSTPREAASFSSSPPSIPVQRSTTSCRNRNRPPSHLAMASVYAKGTRVWLPDPTTGWVAGTVSSITIPVGASPSSEVSLVVTYDADDRGGAPKTFKFPLSVLSAASDGAANNVQPATPPPGQDAVPPLRNPPLLESSEDLASLSNLNEPSGTSMKRACLTSAKNNQFYMPSPPDMPYTCHTHIPASCW